ncbi:MAG: HDOD domain-containing protein, partial [Candidatus Hydrogenedentes bacterium]|nr:HDOD domain-containing protein [Candidatus Hydrogenedentota bacterium]
MGGSSKLDLLLEEVITLPSLPSTLAYITELLNDPNSTLQEVGKAIAADTALALKTLRLVNSAYYG